MLERKHKGIVSLNLKKLASRFNDLKIILILQNEMLVLMLFCNGVLKQREDIPRCGNITKYGTFYYTVYHKPTYNGVYCNFNSFIADEYKHGLIFTLLFRIFSIVSDFSKFHEEVNYLKDVLKKNSFPANLVDKCIKIFLNKQFSQKIIIYSVTISWYVFPLFESTLTKKHQYQHSGISPLTNKRSKSKKSTAVKDHMLICDQPISFDDFKVLASSNFEFHLKIKESLSISRDQPVLNKNEASLSLHLFD